METARPKRPRLVALGDVLERLRCVPELGDLARDHLLDHSEDNGARLFEELFARLEKFFAAFEVPETRMDAMRHALALGSLGYSQREVSEAMVAEGFCANGNEWVRLRYDMSDYLLTASGVDVTKEGEKIERRERQVGELLEFFADKPHHIAVYGTLLALEVPKDASVLVAVHASEERSQPYRANNTRLDIGLGVLGTAVVQYRRQLVTPDPRSREGLSALERLAGNKAVGEMPRAFCELIGQNPGFAPYLSERITVGCMLLMRDLVERDSLNPGDLRKKMSG